MTDAAIPAAAAVVIRAIRWTMRLHHVGRAPLDALRAAGRPYIHAFWHGHLFLMPYSYSGRRIAIMISEHRDGELIARTMGHFGHASIRGSTTSGGAAALRAAVRALRQGADVGFTPDGPRGPAQRVQPGVIQAARLAGAPIVPVAFGASSCKVMASWDGFIVPYPFARGVFLYGEPMTVEQRADRETMERARLALEERMRALAARAGTLARDAGALRRAEDAGPAATAAGTGGAGHA
jgi:lysophospholipid acyltransferase (LPLAT)-like uncharacterized protein